MAGQPDAPGVWLDDDSPGHGRINGRRWRCTDPAIPATLKQELINALMDARRSIASGKRRGDNDDQLALARKRVHAAKVALGERGPKWWLPMSEPDTVRRIQATTVVLLGARGADSSICPSEVARAVRGDDWRVLMPVVREEAWGQVSSGRLRVMQKGQVLEKPAKGAIRIARGSVFDTLWDHYSRT